MKLSQHGSAMMLVFAASIAPQILHAADAPDSTAAAATVLRSANEFYGALAAVQVSSATTIESGAYPMKFEQKVEFLFQRPNLLAARTTGGLSPGEVICDGQELYLAAPMFQRYVRQPAPASLKAINPEAIVIAPGLNVFLDLLSSAAFPDSEGTFTDLGLEDVSGVPCRHLHRANGIQLVDLWFANGEHPWLKRCLRKRLASDLTGPAGDQASGLVGTAAFLQEFGEWRTEAPPREAFAIQPPDGLKQAASIIPNLTDMQQPSSGAAPDFGQSSAGKGAHPLVGTAATPFKLDLVGGGALDLAQHLGKDVVVLDFFATWCRPCLIAMPVVERVAARYQQQGVVLYAVDLAEAGDKVEGFVSEHALTVPVALDRTATVAAKYGVVGVPHTVLIGRDGRVAFVHVGYRPDLEQILEGELQQLVAPSAPTNAGGSR